MEDAIRNRRILNEVCQGIARDSQCEVRAVFDFNNSQQLTIDQHIPEFDIWETQYKGPGTDADLIALCIERGIEPPNERSD